MTGQTGARLLQVLFSAEDMSVFVEYGADDLGERRALRVTGLLQGDGGRGRIDVGMEVPRPGSLGRRLGPGWIELGPRGNQAALVVPAPVFDRLEQVFLAPRRFRLVLGLTVDGPSNAGGRQPVSHVSLLFNPEG
jgi:hypothetical protein